MTILSTIRRLIRRLPTLFATLLCVGAVHAQVSIMIPANPGGG